MHRLVIAMALLLLVVSGGARAEMITNGDFDDSVPSNGTGGGWTSSNIDFAGGWKSSGGNPGAFFALNDAGASATDPTIEQTVTGLVSGQTYNIFGDYKVNIKLGSPDDSFEVLLDGAPISTLDAPGSIGLWGSFSTGFVATATSHTVGFAGETNGTDTDYGVDNIVVTPEPGALAMVLVIGMALLGRRADRREG